MNVSQREQDLKDAAQDARPVKQKTLRQQRSILWRELKREVLEKKQQQTEKGEEEAQLLWLRSEEERLVNLKERKKNTD